MIKFNKPDKMLMGNVNLLNVLVKNNLNI